MISMISVFFSLFIFITPVFAAPLILKGADFSSSSTIPVLFTCDGANILPGFAWENVVARAKSQVIMMSDKNNTLYWAIYNIPVGTTKLKQGSTLLPPGSKYAKNYVGAAAYSGPCPAKGCIQTYTFTLYTLANHLKLHPDATSQDVASAIKDHYLQKASFTASYARWP